MKKSYIRIAQKIYQTPWLITPSVHESIRKQFELAINGRGLDADMPMEPEDPEDDAEGADIPLPVVPSVAVIPVFGVIGKHLSQMEMECGACCLDKVAAQLKQADADGNVTSIILWIASPGGTVTGVQEVAALISDIDTRKPVYAFTDEQACSAAYWLASQARAIFCTSSSNIGSVGCYIYLEDHSKALEMEGIKPNPIVSESSPLKLAGAYFKPMTDDERAMFQKDVDTIYSKFVAAISAKRSVNADYLKGQVVDGDVAVTVGLADGLVMDLDEAISLISKG